MSDTPIYPQSAAMISLGNFSCEPSTSNSMADGGPISHNVKNRSYDEIICSVTWEDVAIPTCRHAPNLSIFHIIDKSMGIASTAGYCSEHDVYTKFRLELNSHVIMYVVGSG